jgi:hypothetical protein
MQCFVCGEQMQVVMVEPHVVDMQGFELRIFQCVGCGDVEKRPVFDSTRSLRPAAPEAISTPVASAPVAGAPAPSNKVNTILGGLVRLGGGTPDP